MELKEFIKTALTDIVTAVKETQESVQEFATIAPITEAGNSTHRNWYFRASDKQRPTVCTICDNANSVCV